MAGMTKHSGLLGVVASCSDCGWSSDANNALGNAAQHAKKYQHEVLVEQTISVIYNKKKSE